MTPEEIEIIDKVTSEAADLIASLRSELALKEKQLDAADKLINVYHNEPSIDDIEGTYDWYYRQLTPAQDEYHQLKNTKP